jgi:hypothetical protein
MAYETHRRISITDPWIVYTFNCLYLSTILYVFYRAAIADDHLEKAAPAGTVIFPTPEHHVRPELHQTLVCAFPFFAHRCPLFTACP